MGGLNYCFLLWTLLVYGVHAWPDGAPCVRAAYESMNPLEAVEHQGGLQLTIPPFNIEVKQKCYWVNQPIELTIQGNTTKDQFKGFAIQPFVYEGSSAGSRIGQFLRLDDNGSWRQQCFQKRDSVTHSHDEKKKKITLWWKNDRDETSTVQFVGTVVISLRQFWVKSVFSNPIPPCKQREEISNWQRPPVTAPPAVGQFKSDTFRIFNQGNSEFLANSLANARQPIPVVQAPQPTPRPAPQPTELSPAINDNRPPVRMPVSSFRQNPFAPQQTRPVPIQPPQAQTRQRLTHIIPLPNMEMNSRPRQSSGRRPFLVSSSTTPARAFQPSSLQCIDRQPMNRCMGWIQFCQLSTFMQASCRRSCQLC